MKLLYFDDYRLGVLKGDAVVDVSDLVREIPHVTPSDLISGLIERFDDYRQRLAAAVERRTGVPLSAVVLRAPLPRPAQIVCMGVNYTEPDPHNAAPTGGAIAAFLKASSSVIGPGQSIVLPDVPAGAFEAEAELAVVIGSPTSHVSAADAMKSVFGYTCFIDGSARGLPPQQNLLMLYSMKSRETFAPLGPYLVTADEIADPQRLQIRLRNNGTLMQDFNTSAMTYDIASCIEWISSVHPLTPGDVIATGTDHGGLHPIQDGDVLDLDIAGVGELRVRVRDDLKRAWPRETRRDRKARGLSLLVPQLSGKYAPAN